MRCIEVFTRFVAPNSQEPPVPAVPVPILARDLYLRVIKNYKGPTILVDNARNQIAQQAKVEDA